MYAVVEYKGNQYKAEKDAVLQVSKINDAKKGDTVTIDTVLLVSDGDKVSVEDVVWHPLIEHREGSTDTVYLVRDYSSDLAGTNELLASLDNPYDWIVETTREVIDEDFTIDLPTA